MLKSFLKKYFPTSVDFYKKWSQDIHYKKIQLPRLKYPLNFFVVGARGSLSPFIAYLRRKKIVRTIGFEPDPIEHINLSTAGFFDIVLPFALGSRHEEKKLKLTKERGCSSILHPNMEAIKTLCTKPEWFMVDESLTIETHRFDDIEISNEVEYTPNMLQIDVQGYEIEVLKGFGVLLATVKIVQVESVFYPVYKQQPLFNEMHDFMTQNNFYLFSIEKQGVYGNRFVEANVIYINNKYYKSADNYAGINEIDQFCLNNCKNIFH